MHSRGAGPDSGVPGRPAGVNGQLFDEIMATGAIVAGRGTFEPADGWGGDHHDGVPIWILSRQPPGMRYFESLVSTGVCITTFVASTARSV
jgi:hypothetical protein